MSRNVADPILPMDEKWLVDTINKATPGAEGVLKNYKCSTIAENKGFLSVITRVTLNWDAEKSKGVENLPKGVICKQPTNTKLDQISVEIAKYLNDKILSAVHNQECDAYKVLSHTDCPLPIAKCYYIEKMERIGEGMLILEDLTEQASSLSFGDHMSKGQVFALCKYFGLLQAYGLNNPETRETLDAFDVSAIFGDDVFSNLDRQIKKTHEIWPDFPFTPEEVMAKFEECIKIFDFTKPIESQNLLAVLALGDVQPNNILWERSKMDPERMSDTVCAFIDFQSAGPNLPTNDIVTSITMGLSAEMRRKIEDEMLELYWKNLQNNLTPEGKARCKMTFAELRKLYRMNVLMNALFAAPKHMGLMTKLGIGEEFKIESRKRLVTAIEDFDKP